MTKDILSDLKKAVVASQKKIFEHIKNKKIPKKEVQAAPNPITEDTKVHFTPKNYNHKKVKTNFLEKIFKVKQKPFPSKKMINFENIQKKIQKQKSETAEITPKILEIPLPKPAASKVINTNTLFSDFETFDRSYSVIVTSRAFERVGQKGPGSKGRRPIIIKY